MNLRSCRLPFQVQIVEGPASVTAHAGLPLVIEAFRALGLPEAVREHLPFKRRLRGYSEATFVETLVAMLAAGGECVDDVRVLQADAGLKRLWGRSALPAAETLRAFLNRFHDEGAVGQRVAHTAFIPEESAGLKGLGAIQAELLRALQERVPQAHATLDVDATVIESSKRTALPVYEGGTGYQPLQVWWAEQGVWVKSRFRDGNVPAQCGVREIVRESVATLRALGITEFAVRSDTAGYQHSLLNELREAKIRFAISADMSPELKAAVLRLPVQTWKPLLKTDPERGGFPSTREWAEVEFIPARGTYQRHAQPDRYLVVRARPFQLPLFAEGEAFRYYATVTNDWDTEGASLLQWSYERCGTVEPAHDILKNELGGGVLPSQRFGANAAWWQLVILTANLLSALKRIALPEAWRPLRPRRLRFLLFHHAGRLVQHGRRLLLRIALDHPGSEPLRNARDRLFPAAT